MSIHKHDMPWRPLPPLAVTPASRATDSLGSVDAEEWINRSGKRAENQRRVLKGFVQRPCYTTAELAPMIQPLGWEASAWRTEVARRTPELCPIYLERIKAPAGAKRGNREFRWTPTEAGKRVAGEWG